MKLNIDVVFPSTTKSVLWELIPQKWTSLIPRQVGSIYIPSNEFINCVWKHRFSYDSNAGFNLTQIKVCFQVRLLRSLSIQFIFGISLNPFPDVFLLIHVPKVLINMVVWGILETRSRSLSYLSWSFTLPRLKLKYTPVRNPYCLFLSLPTVLTVPIWVSNWEESWTPS